MFIYTVTGQIMHQRVLLPGSDGTEISVANFPPGLYLVLFSSDRGWYQRKLIKQ